MKAYGNAVAPAVLLVVPLSSLSMFLLANVVACIGWLFFSPPAAALLPIRWLNELKVLWPFIALAF